MDYVKSKSGIVIRGTAAVIAGLLAISIFSLSGCGSSQQSDEELVRSSLASELDSIKNLDEKFVNEISEAIDMSRLSLYGIDGMEFMRSYLSGFDYSIDAVTVDGETAQAQLTLTCKSYTGYQKALQAAVDDITANPDELAGLSNDDINKKIGEIVIQSLDGVELKPTEPVTINYTKVDDTWEAASSTSGDIAAALMTN
ncbi:hypothetical protein AALA69_08650 [Eggerthellaceae bacterium 24-137]